MPSAETVSEMVGAQYGFCQPQPGQDDAEAVTPRSLHVMTALLLRHGVIKLQHIWPWVSGVIGTGVRLGRGLGLICIGVATEVFDNGVSFCKKEASGWTA